MSRMGRRRKSNKNLPPRVYIHGASYRYVPRAGHKVTLAKVGDFGGMLRALADILGAPDGQLPTLGAVMDRYLLEVTPGKCPGLQRKEPAQIAKLRAVFGHFRPGELNKVHAYQYHAKRALRAPTAATREVELLRHVCTIAEKWSAAWPVNPLLGISLDQPKPRRHYVTDDELEAVRELAPPMIRAAVDLAVLTGLRRGDILALERDAIRDDGLYVEPSKTKASTAVALLFEWSPALRQTVRDALAQAPQVRRTIICNSAGRPYTSSGFDKAWQRVIRKHIRAGGERFQFKDLRKKSATDELDAGAASQRLGHSSQAITDRVYRLRPRTVRPLR